MSTKADSRSVSTDALETLGTVIDHTQKRDAIHLAVIPVLATATVYPGQHVDGLGTPVTAYSSEAVGIVDPFVSGPVYPGQHFWLVIYPRKITSLRHVWSHPAFQEEPVSNVTDVLPSFATGMLKSKPAEPAEIIAELKKRKAVEFIRNEADSVGLSYQRLIDAATDYLHDGSYVTGGDEMEGVYLNQEFWDHYEIITGTKVPQDDRGSFFSCSC